MKLFSTVIVAGLLFTVAARADVLSDLQSMGLVDVKQAEAIYAANPNVPTYKAANQCLVWEDSVLSAPNAPINIGVAVLPPKGVASAIADLDVTLSATGNGIPPIVDQFNENCAWYVEDLKAAAAAHANNFVVFGFKL